jgi:hypothetical protein
MKLLFKPFGLIAGLIAGWLGKSIFKAVWAKIVGAKALEAATLAGTAAAADRLAARAFHHLTGYWPGKDPEPK